MGEANWAKHSSCQTCLSILKSLKLYLNLIYLFIALNLDEILSSQTQLNFSHINFIYYVKSAKLDFRFEIFLDTKYCSYLVWLIGGLSAN